MQDNVIVHLKSSRVFDITSATHQVIIRVQEQLPARQPDPKCIHPSMGCAVDSSGSTVDTVSCTIHRSTQTNKQASYNAQTQSHPLAIVISDHIQRTLSPIAYISR